MRCRSLLLTFLLLMDTVGQTLSQEEYDLGDDDDTLSNSAVPSPATTLLYKPSAPPDSALEPTSIPNFEEQFLLIRPLHNIEISLYGIYNSTRQDQLLNILKSLLEAYLYHDMLDFFVHKSDNDGHVFNRTTHTINLTAMTEDEVEDLSILSTVFLTWTSTYSTFVALDDSTVTVRDPIASPNMHTLRASGSLGFSKYDYTLLHPHTIVALQEAVLLGDGGEDGSRPILWSKLESAVQSKGFALEVLDISILGAEQVPTQSPTEWTFGDDEDLADNVHDQEGSDDVVSADSTTSDSTTLNDKEERDEPRRINHSVSKETIRSALIAASVASAAAFGCLMLLIRYKTRRIKIDHRTKKQRISEKTDDENKDEKDDTGKDSKVTCLGARAGSMEEQSFSSESLDTSNKLGGTTIVDLSGQLDQSTSKEPSATPEVDIEAGKKTDGGQDDASTFEIASV